MKAKERKPEEKDRIFESQRKETQGKETEYLKASEKKTRGRETECLKTKENKFEERRQNV
jgi:hypothetical protein